MKNRYFTAVSGALFAFALGVATFSHAQATRTWVSGVGDDVNPCSRTAPCKTFAGAISKTVAGGEISVLDPGGYGSVTITKAITIDGGQGGGWAGIVHSGAAGIIVNAAAGDAVTLRNLSINGAGTGSNGIRIIGGGRVFIENVQIFGNGGGDPTGRGISDQRTAGGQLIVTNTIVRNNTQSGIVILPSSGSTTIDVSLRNVHLVGNGNAGLAALAGSHVTVTGSVISANLNYGVAVEQPAGSTQLFLADTVIADNQYGLFVGSGSPTIRLGNVSITNNDVGVQPGGTIFTFGNNRISGNLTGNPPAMTPVAPQ